MKKRTLQNDVHVEIRNAHFNHEKEHACFCDNKRRYSRHTPAFYVRAKDFVGNTYTLDITNELRKLLSERKMKLCDKIAKAIARNMLEKKVYLDKDTLEIKDLENFIPK